MFLAAVLLSMVGTLTAQLTQGSPITLNCKYEMVAHFWGPQYTCIGQNVVVDTFDTYVSGVSGTHMDGKGTRDVKAVFFENQRTTFVPLMLSKIFPNLEAMRIQASGLKTVNQTSFSNSGGLKYIHLDDNKIEFIPKKTFYNLTDLEWISIGANKIKAIHPDMLRGLTELRYFSASKNEIEVVGSSLLRDNVKVEKILFYNNKLKMIGWSLVRLLVDLKKARFDGNVCTNINISDESDISNQLTNEFAQKCSVSCLKTFNEFDIRIENLMDQSQKLSRKMMSNKLEKQSLKFNCANRDY